MQRWLAILVFLLAVDGDAANSQEAISSAARGESRNVFAYGSKDSRK